MDYVVDASCTIALCCQNSQLAARVVAVSLSEALHDFALALCVPDISGYNSHI